MKLVETIDITNEVSLSEFAKGFRPAMQAGVWLALEGELGAGKTTFVRHLMRAFGYSEPVQSPSYPLMLEYDLQSRKLVHIDGFRLSGKQPEPWDWADWKTDNVIVEWPDKLSQAMERYDYKLRFILDDKAEKRTLEVYKKAGHA